MTERYDHRDDETRAADAERPEVLDTPVLDGADDLQTEASRAVENQRLDEDSASDG
jgi:hypothetical protein